MRPADGDALCRVARSRRRRTRPPRSRPRGRRRPSGRARTAVERGNVVRAIAELLRERREEASELVAAETGKSLALALGETDAAVEMGFFVAGEGRRSYGRTTTASMPHRTVLTLRRPVGVAALLDLVQHAAPERRLEGVPVDLLRERLGAEAVRACAAVGVVARPALSRGGPAAGCAERRPGPRAGGGDAARRGPGRRPRQLHRARRRPGARSRRRPVAASRRR